MCSKQNQIESTVWAIGVVRVSTDKQRQESLEAQKDVCKRLAIRTLGFEPELKWNESWGSGEDLDRKGLKELDALITSGKYDYLFTENLDRIMRDTSVLQILKKCKQLGLRVVTANGLDTASSMWRLQSLLQAGLSEEEQEKTSARIKRQLRHEFETGGYLPHIPWGYVHKPPQDHEGARREEHVHKDPTLEVVFLEMVDMLFDGAGYADVASQLDTQKVPPPGKGDRWHGRMVRNIVMDPIRTGLRRFGMTETEKDLLTGRRQSRPRKQPLVNRMVEHLRMIEPERHAALLALLRKRNAHQLKKNRRNPDKKHRGRVRLFPTQILKCTACGRRYNCAGTTEATGPDGPQARRRLRCEGVPAHDCWVSSVLHYPTLISGLFGELVRAAVEVFNDPEPLRRMVADELADLNGSWSKRIDDQRAVCAKLKRSRDRLVDAITKSEREISSLLQPLTEFDEQYSVESNRLSELEANPPTEITIPPADEIRAMLLELRDGFDPADGLAGKQLLRLVTSMEAYPFRLVGSPSIYTFVLAEIDLSGLCRPAESPSIRERTTRCVMLPAFTTPEPVRLLDKVRALTAEGVGSKIQSQRLGCHWGTVKKAQALLDAMERDGLDSPFVPVTDPSVLKSNGRCRKNIKFRPVKGHSLWAGDLAGLPPLPDLSE